jgi:uroporphyrinogen-III decarboxylase
MAHGQLHPDNLRQGIKAKGFIHNPGHGIGSAEDIDHIYWHGNIDSRA